MSDVEAAPMPDPHRAMALFLDFDGTLADIAPDPDAVALPPGVVDTLLRLHDRLGGALAIVSGRPVDALDRLLAPARLPTAGQHGAERRDATGALHRQPPPDVGLLLATAESLVAEHPALLLERKPNGFALHYRRAPELGDLCRDTLAPLLQGHPQVELLLGKCVVEVKPAGASKGAAAEAFMAEAPFAGRTPVFVGDDVTDETGFASVRRLGGHAIKVGEGPSLAQWRCASPQALREWLAEAAA